MKNYFFLSLFLTFSCTQISKKTQIPDIPVSIADSQIKECLNCQKNVLDKAYNEVKGTKYSEYVFTKDVREAREILAQFDVSKGLSKSKAIVTNNILNNCSESRIKQFELDYKILGECSLMFSELNFFQSLAVAIRKNKWPIDLRLEAKKVALDYVRYFSEGSFPLLNRLVALSVLDELSVNQVVNKDLHPEIKVLMQDSRLYVEALRMKLNKEPGLKCQSLEIVREELAYSDLMAKKIQNFLTRL